MISKTMWKSLGATAIIAVAIFFMGHQTIHAESSVHWKDHETAPDQSKASGKPLIIHFYADWCSWCKKMDKNTFSEESVASYINDKFIATRINTEKNSDIAAAFRVRGLPDTWFFTSEGESITHFPGFMPAEQFLSLLKYIGSNSFKSMDFEAYLKKSGAEN